MAGTIVIQSIMSQLEHIIITIQHNSIHNERRHLPYTSTVSPLILPAEHISAMKESVLGLWRGSTHGHQTSSMRTGDWTTLALSSKEEYKRRLEDTSGVDQWKGKMKFIKIKLLKDVIHNEISNKWNSNKRWTGWINQIQTNWINQIQTTELIKHKQLN